MSSEVSTIAGHHSVLNGMMIEYLRCLIKHLNNVGWQIGDEPLKIEDFAIEQRVITKIERKRERDEEQRFATSLEPTSKFYEIESDAEKYETITWSNAVNQYQRLGIKGSPGSGKTASSRLSAIAIARASKYNLDNFYDKLERIKIPIWITAKELSQRPETDIADALVDIIKEKPIFKNSEITDYFYNWLKGRIRKSFSQNADSSENNPFFIVVDALDELSGNLDNFERLAPELDKPLVQLMATCRTLQWEGKRGLLGWDNLVSLELAPLKKYQKTEFLERFFSQNEKAKESAKTIFDNNYAIDYATDNSLILTFVCLLHLKEKISEKTTYIDIYTQM